MANESKIIFEVSPAKWHANEYLYHNVLNGQVNANRNLITAIIEGLNPFYKNANDEDKKIDNPGSVTYNAGLIANALRGILDTTKSGINIDIKSGADITLEAASGKLIEAKSDVKIDQNATFANENPIVTITRNLILKGTQGTIKIGEYNSEPSEVNNNFDNFDVTTKNRVGLYQRTISGWSNIRTEHAKFVAQINDNDVHQGDLHLISNFIIGEKGDDFEDIGLFYNASLDNGYEWYLNHNAYELTAYGKTSNSMWYNLELTKDSFEVSGSLNNWKMIVSDDDLIVSNTATGNQLYSIVTNIKARVLKEQTYPNGKGIVGNDGGDIYLLNRDAYNTLRYGLHITDSDIYIQKGSNARESLFGKQPKLYEHRIKMTFPGSGANNPTITVYFSFSNTDSQSYHNRMGAFFTYLHKNINSAYNVSGIDLDTNESYFAIPQYVDGFNTQGDGGAVYFWAQLHYVLVSAVSQSVMTNYNQGTINTTTVFTKTDVARSWRFDDPADNDKIYDDVLPL